MRLSDLAPYFLKCTLRGDGSVPIAGVEIDSRRVSPSRW